MSGWDKEDFLIKEGSTDFKLNRRASKRVTFSKKVKFGRDETVFPADSYNISQKGILIHSFKAFIPGTPLNIKLYTDNETVRLNAEVKWVIKTRDHSGSFMGLNFIGNNFEIRKLYLKQLGLMQNGELKH